MLIYYFVDQHHKDNHKTADVSIANTIHYIATIATTTRMTMTTNITSTAITASTIIAIVMIILAIPVFVATNCLLVL